MQQANRHSPGHCLPDPLVGLVAVLMIVALVVVGFGDTAGLVQRVFILLVFGWPVLLAVLPSRR